MFPVSISVSGRDEDEEDVEDVHGIVLFFSSFKCLSKIVMLFMRGVVLFMGVMLSRGRRREGAR